MENDSNSPSNSSSSSSSSLKELSSPISCLGEPWIFSDLKMEEVLEDSPLFRDKLKALRTEVKQNQKQITNIIELSKKINETSSTLSQLCKQLTEEIKILGSSTKGSIQPPIEISDSVFNTFQKNMNELENFRIYLNIQVNNILVEPLETLLKEKLELNEKKKNFKKATEKLDISLSKSSKNLKGSEFDQDFVEAKKKYQVGSLDYLFGLYEFLKKCKLEAIDRSCSYMDALFTYFKGGYQFLMEQEPFIQNLGNQIQTEKENFSKSKEKADNYKKNLFQITHFNKMDENSNTITPKIDAKEIQGHLFKRSNNVRKDWKKRYFVVENGNLCYYRKGKTSQPEQIVNLLLCTVKPRPDLDRRFCFEIISPTKSFFLQAEDEEKLHEWISVIQNATTSLLNAQTLMSTKSSSILTVFQEPLVQRDSKPIEILRKIESNRFCADCGQPDPDWASINLGILLCIECSGFHRNMGVHVSKIRSVTLDKWEPEILKYMTYIGNEKFNSIYECYLPLGVVKPTPDSDKKTRETFIKLKYIEKKCFQSTNKSIDELNLDLYKASKDNEVLKILQLISQGASPNFVNSKEGLKTPLHVAVIQQNLVSVVGLVQNKANPNLQDSQGFTPLHYAALNGNIKCGIALFRGGARIDILDNSNSSPLDIAVNNGRADMATFLRLASLANSEENDDSFQLALQEFAFDSQTKNEQEKK